MAIYHFHAQTISRSQGRSAVAAAAYRSGSTLVSSCGEVFDYSKKNDVMQAKIIVPAGCLTIDRQELWCMAERAEKRKNSCLAREADIALPVELTDEEGFRVASIFCQWLADEYGVAVDCCQHAGRQNCSNGNPHIHVMWTTRRYMPDGKLGAKTRELDSLKTRTAHLKRIRSQWADCCNQALQCYGTSIDARSYTEQHVDRIPQIHLGPAVSAMEKRGISTERGVLNRSIISFNHAVEQLNQEYTNVTNELDENDIQRRSREAISVNEARHNRAGEAISRRRLEPRSANDEKSAAGTPERQKTVTTNEHRGSAAVHGSAGTPGSADSAGGGTGPAKARTGRSESLSTEHLVNTAYQGRSNLLAFDKQCQDIQHTIVSLCEMIYSVTDARDAAYIASRLEEISSPEDEEQTLSFSP